LVAIIGAEQAREAFRRMSRPVEAETPEGKVNDESKKLESTPESLSEESSGIS
jgi:hypothetical protein